jgi:hypothetical protein
MSQARRFATALGARDLDAAVALLADGVVFRRPVVFRPYHGRGPVRGILAAVFRVLEDWRCVREIGAGRQPGSRAHVRGADRRAGDRGLRCPVHSPWQTP